MNASEKQYPVTTGILKEIEMTIGYIFAAITFVIGALIAYDDLKDAAVKKDKSQAKSWGWWWARDTAVNAVLRMSWLPLIFNHTGLYVIWYYRIIGHKILNNPKISQHLHIT